jgi:hypothetical protein
LKITAFTRYSYILDTKNAEISRKLEKIQVHQNTSRETLKKEKVQTCPFEISLWAPNPGPRPTAATT